MSVADELAAGQSDGTRAPARRPRGIKSTFIPAQVIGRRGSVELEDPMPFMGMNFVVDTMLLDHEQRSIYIQLLAHAWKLKKPLRPDPEWLGRISGVKKARFIRVFMPIAHRFFDISEDGWRPNAGHIDDPQSRRLPDVEWALLRKQVFTRDNFTCSYCMASDRELECDHIVPISRGGSNGMENLTTACKKCNRAKGDRTVEEWLGEES